MADLFLCKVQNALPLLPPQEITIPQSRVLSTKINLTSSMQSCKRTPTWNNRSLETSRCFKASPFKSTFHGTTNFISIPLNKQPFLRSSKICISQQDIPDSSTGRPPKPGMPLTLPLVLLSGLAGLSLEGTGSVLEAIGVLALIVAVHECGHFLAARIQNIHVSKFSIGFGPVLARLQGKEVEYSLRAFPLGGFVAFPDDDPNSPYPPDDPNLLKNRPIADRAAVISAGVVANFLCAYLVLLIQVSSVGLLQQSFREGVAVPGILEDSAAGRAGVQGGDVILEVNGIPLSSGEAAVTALVDEIKSGGGGAHVQLAVLRNQELLSFDVTTDKSTDGSGRVGLQLAPNAEVYRQLASSPGEAAIVAGKEFSRLFSNVAEGLSRLVFDFAKTAEKVSGPVAIVAVGAEVARNDISGLFQFAALVNLNLAVVNILPLPALDGGYLALLLVEAVRGGRKLPSNVEQSIMSSGIILLVGSGLFLIVRDTINLGGAF